jgi:hypothetical protein
MAIPQPTEDNVNATKESIDYTEGLKKLTINISNMIGEQENLVAGFLKRFEAFVFWATQNKASATNFRQLILDRLQDLEEHANQTKRVLEMIRNMTQQEEKAVSKKLMIAIQVGDDFSAQEHLVKQLNYPGDVASLAKRVARSMADVKDEVHADLKLEMQAEELLEKAMVMMNNIIVWLGTCRNYVTQSPDLAALQGELEKAVRGIRNELLFYQRLGTLEKTHLSLLLQIFEKESQALSKETEFGQKEGTPG